MVSLSLNFLFKFTCRISAANADLRRLSGRRNIYFAHGQLHRLRGEWRHRHVSTWNPFARTKTEEFQRPMRGQHVDPAGMHRHAEEVPRPDNPVTEVCLKVRIRNLMMFR